MRCPLNYFNKFSIKFFYTPEKSEEPTRPAKKLADRSSLTILLCAQRVCFQDAGKYRNACNGFFSRGDPEDGSATSSEKGMGALWSVNASLLKSKNSPFSPFSEGHREAGGLGGPKSPSQRSRA